MNADGGYGVDAPTNQQVRVAALHGCKQYALWAGRFISFYLASGLIYSSASPDVQHALMMQLAMQYDVILSCLVTTSPDAPMLLPDVCAATQAYFSDLVKTHSRQAVFQQMLCPIHGDTLFQWMVSYVGRHHDGTTHPDYLTPQGTPCSCGNPEKGACGQPVVLHKVMMYIFMMLHAERVPKGTLPIRFKLPVHCGERIVYESPWPMTWPEHVTGMRMLKRRTVPGAPSRYEIFIPKAFAAMLAPYIARDGTADRLAQFADELARSKNSFQVWNMFLKWSGNSSVFCPPVDLSAYLHFTQGISRDPQVQFTDIFYCCAAPVPRGYTQEGVRLHIPFNKTFHLRTSAGEKFYKVINDISPK